MDFKNLISDFLSSLIIVLRRYLNLIFAPYRTMRKISLEKDYIQVAIIFSFALFYFYFRNIGVRQQFPPFVYFLIFSLNFFLTILFFHLGGFLFNRKVSLDSLLFTFSYALYPTLTWFAANSIFYIFIPPPRTFSLLGQSFSIFFLTFSISLLFWKIILFYLAVRFSTKLNFFPIVYLVLLYCLFFIPITYGLYLFGLFKIPFI